VGGFPPLNSLRSGLQDDRDASRQVAQGWTTSRGPGTIPVKPGTASRTVWVDDPRENQSQDRPALSLLRRLRPCPAATAWTREAATTARTDGDWLASGKRQERPWQKGRTVFVLLAPGSGVGVVEKVDANDATLRHRLHLPSTTPISYGAGLGLAYVDEGRTPSQTRRALVL
jgi:hypothetical protein